LHLRRGPRLPLLLPLRRSLAPHLLLSLLLDLARHHVRHRLFRRARPRIATATAAAATRDRHGLAVADDVVLTVVAAADVRAMRRRGPAIPAPHLHLLPPPARGPAPDS